MFGVSGKIEGGVDVRERWLGALLLVLSLGMIFILLQWHDPGYINPDSAQLISTAENLLHGDGLKTSIVYYHEQISLGALPVPQTVWPPGFALVVSFLLFVGVNGVVAAVVIAAGGMFVSVAATYVLGRMLGLSSLSSFCAALVVLTFMPLGVLVVSGMSDTAYTSATLVAIIAFLKFYRGGFKTSVVIAFGAICAAALLFRYIGVCWIAACGMLVVAAKWRNRSHGIARALAAFSLVPVVVGVWLFARNILISDSLTGGPALGGDVSLLEAVRSIYWSTTKLFGAVADPWQPLLAVAGVVIVVALLVWMMGGWFRQSRGNYSEVRWLLCFVTLLYCASTGAVMIILTFGLYSDFPQPRYFAPLFPLLVLCGAVLVEEIGPVVKDLRPPARAVCWMLFGGILLVYWYGQWSVAKAHAASYEKNPRTILMAEMEKAHILGDSMVVYLKSRVTNERPLLTFDGQSVAAVLGIASIGLPEPRYSHTVWGESAVKGIVDDHGVCHILVDLDSAKLADSVNRVFLEQLMGGNAPDWLMPVFQSPQLRLYRVRVDRCQ